MSMETGGLLSVYVKGYYITTHIAGLHQRWKPVTGEGGVQSAFQGVKRVALPRAPAPDNLPLHTLAPSAGGWHRM